MGLVPPGGMVRPVWSSAWKSEKFGPSGRSVRGVPGFRGCRRRNFGPNPGVNLPIRSAAEALQSIRAAANRSSSLFSAAPAAES